METKQNYNGDIKTEMEELEKLNCTQSEVPGCFGGGH